jgi:hypothetical protein
MDQARQWSADLAAMFTYFTEVGLDIDTADLRGRYPEVRWHTFANWTAAQTRPAP